MSRNKHTLVLDQSNRPVEAVKWEKAFTDLYLGKVDIVREYDEQIRSVLLQFPKPAVVRKTEQHQDWKRIVRLSRYSIFRRDGFKCAYCHVQFSLFKLTIDHVIPRARGGKATWENMVACCVSCNKRKGAHTPEEVGMRLRKIPIKPGWLPPTSFALGNNHIPEEWLEFLKAA